MFQTRVSSHFLVQVVTLTLFALLAGPALLAQRAEAQYPVAAPLMIMDADGSRQHVFAVVPGYEEYGLSTWSHDGSRVAFAARRGSNAKEESHIFVAKADGSDVRDLGVGALMSWAPDDQQLAFFRLDHEPGIWVMHADGTGRERLTANGLAPHWSPDGTEIAYIGSPDPSLRIEGSMKFGYGRSSQKKWAAGAESFVGICSYHTLDGSVEPLVLNDELHYNLGFQWSPDGSRLAFIGCTDNHAKELVIVSGRGKEQKRTVRLSGDLYRFGTHVCWSGDGKRLLLEYRPLSGSTHALSWLDVDSHDPPEPIPGQDPSRHAGDMTVSPDGSKIVFSYF